MINKEKVDNMVERLQTIDLTGHDALVTKCMDASYLIKELYDEVKSERIHKESYLDNLNTIFTAQAESNKIFKKLLLKKGN